MPFLKNAAVRAVSSVLLASAVVCSPLLAATGEDRLRSFLDDVRTLTADFDEQVLDQQGNVVQEAQGNFSLARPGRFRWDYRKPYEQLIVADGDRLWVYDVELEQVTVKAQDQALSQTPAMLLSGSAGIDERFHVEELGVREGLQWIELRPLQQEGNFERIRLAFQGNALTRMEMVDAFEQITSFRFERVQPNVQIAPEVFRFDPPPGSDVVGDIE